MNFGEFQNGKAQQPLPQSLATHEAEIAHFADLCTRTCNRILKLLALGLEVPTPFPFHPTAQLPYRCPRKNIYIYIYKEWERGAYTNNPRSHPTSSQPATIPTKAPQAPSSATCTTHPFHPPQQQPTSTTSTSAPARTPTTAVSRSYSNGQDSRV